MPTLIARRKVLEFQRVFDGPLDSLAALYRRAMADALDILGNAAASLAQRRRALAQLRQYNLILTDLRDEAALWLQTNLPAAYRLGMNFADQGLRNITRAGINLGRPRYEVFAQVHQQAVAAVTEELLRTMDYAIAQIGRRVGDVFRRVGMEEVAKGVAEGKARIEVSKQIKQRLLAEGRPFFVDRRGHKWDLDRYTEMVARTTTRETMTQGTMNRLREHGLDLMMVDSHGAQDFCRYYEGMVVSISGTSPNYPPVSSLPGMVQGNHIIFHPNCRHVLTPFVEQLASPEEIKAGTSTDPTIWGRTPAKMQQRFRRDFPERARAEGKRLRQQATSHHRQAERRLARAAR